MKAKIKNIFVQGAISAEQIGAAIQKHGNRTKVGAHSIFLGQVRTDEKDKGRIKAIEYTAYEEMALEKAHRIRENAFAKFPLICLHIYHSLGEVKVGEICMFVFVSSCHRRAAMDCCQEVVERLKNELPVWGKEVAETGLYGWKKNR